MSWEKAGVIFGFIAAIAALIALKPILFPPPDPPLISEKTGIDYSKLRDLLAKKQWKKADQETVNTMLQVVGKQKGDSFTYDDINFFPCQDLSTINKLWFNASGGKFGFSIQNDFYVNAPGDRYVQLKTLASRVGWLEDDEPIAYSDVSFDLENAPPGHLPAKIIVEKGMGRTDLLHKELAICEYNGYDL